MATGNTLVEAARLKIGVGSPGQTFNADRTNLLLAELNRMWSIWSAELAPVYQHTIDSLTWTSGSASMTIGAAGDLVTARPIEIISMQARVSSTDWTIDPISLEAYQQLSNKTETSAYPEFYAYDGTFPSGTIYLWRKPDSNMTLRITSKKTLTAFTLDGTVSLPDGYEKALIDNLAVEIAPFFGKEASSAVKLSAMNSKRTIIRINDQSTDVYPNSAIPGIQTYNYQNN